MRNSGNFYDVSSTRSFPALAEAYARNPAFFFHAFPQYSEHFIAQVLFDKKGNRMPPSQMVRQIAFLKERFCGGIWELKFAARIALLDTDGIARVTAFVGSLGEEFPIQNILAARRALIREARFRGIYVSFPKGVSVGENTSNVLLSKDVAENIRTRVRTASETTNKVDMLVKRLSRRMGKIASDNYRLEFASEDKEKPQELVKILKQFIQAHVTSSKEWDGPRIAFPTKPGKIGLDNGWAYFIVLTRLLRDLPGGREVLDQVCKELQTLSKTRPEDIEARSFARALNSVIIKELSDAGGEVFETILGPVIEGKPIELSVQEVPQTSIVQVQNIDIPKKLLLPRRKPFKAQEIVTPEPEFIGEEIYTSTLSRIGIHPANRDESYVHLFGTVVEASENGKNPIAIRTLPRHLQEDILWMFAKCGVDGETGAELVHRKSGIRLVIDDTKTEPIVWAWTAYSNEQGEPIVTKNLF